MQKAGLLSAGGGGNTYLRVCQTLGNVSKQQNRENRRRSLQLPANHRRFYSCTCYSANFNVNSIQQCSFERPRFETLAFTEQQGSPDSFCTKESFSCPLVTDIKEFLRIWNTAVWEMNGGLRIQCSVLSKAPYFILVWKSWKSKAALQG